MSNRIQDLKEELLRSHWPKCGKIADEIASYNKEAKNALVEALEQGKRHHIRTAAVKALANLKDISVVEDLKKILDDPAYEPRMEAKKALKELTGEVYLTSRGE